MKKIWLLLIFLSFNVLSNDTKSITATSNGSAAISTNEDLQDSRVGEQFIPIKKTKEDNIVSYSLIDRQSVTLHPYNKRIRVFNEIINFSPELVFEKTKGEKIKYKSMEIQQYINCDKKEIAKGPFSIYEKYFAEGDLIDTNNTPNRWIADNRHSDDHQLLIIACSLPLVEQPK
ncbi:surface-adhesin E family protein [Gilliamella sp. wkB112]|uniref:surface-adhesin E family protein n=1 Tax=Gilliamella sp. wkB112 TaxID=3120257 RepID=UPI00080E2034|nr:surface-adhesin E family protein [Gilliamella apicola]OCG03157.1 hypothetical protein A9G12_09605 [Gilliamella apicola]